jgi:hypothetical protein
MVIAGESDIVDGIKLEYIKLVIVQVHDEKSVHKKSPPGIPEGFIGRYFRG